MKLNNLSLNIFELGFFQDQNEWRQKLGPCEISKNESDKDINLLIYKSHYVLFENFYVFLRKHDCKFICRRCLSSYLYQNTLTKHMKRCSRQEIPTIKT